MPASYQIVWEPALCPSCHGSGTDCVPVDHPLQGLAEVSVMSDHDGFSICYLPCIRCSGTGFAEPRAPRKAQRSLERWAKSTAFAWPAMLPGWRVRGLVDRAGLVEDVESASGCIGA